MQTPIHQLNFKSHRIPPISKWPCRNDQSDIPVNAFVFACWRDIFQAFVQHQRIIHPQQGIPGILPLPALFVLVIYEQIIFGWIAAAKWKQGIIIAETQITVYILKTQRHLYKTIITESAVEYVNPLKRQRWRRRYCIFALVAGTQ